MKKSALVLSGGGSLGMAHIGAITELNKKYVFDFYAGVSAGAIIAAALACGKTITDIENQITTSKLFKLCFDLSGTDFGFLKGEKIWQFLADFFAGKEFKDLDCPLYIGATNFSTGKRVIIKNGLIADAVRASISIPIFFEPFYHQEQWLVDGCLSQNFPLDIAINKYKGDLIWGIDVATSLNDKVNFAERKFGKKIIRMQSLVERSLRIFFKNQQQFPDDPRVKIIKPDLEEFNAASIYKMSVIKARGKKAALLVC